MLLHFYFIILNPKVKSIEIENTYADIKILL